MVLVTGSLVPMLKIKFKARCDDYIDQFNRILMVKLSMIACIILGLHWFKDTLTCIIPGAGGIDGGFVKQACWIRGVYIYDDPKLNADINMLDGNNFRYYGIPKELKYDGIRTTDNKLCNADSDDKDCVGMKRVFFRQYQWFPFYMGAIALLYYLPYIIFRVVNGDLITLKTVIVTDDVDVHAIVRNYMTYARNPRHRMTMRLLGNVFCKMFYVMANIVALVGTDSLLNGTFLSLGSEMAEWNSLDNNSKLDYTASRTKFRAGDRMLPAFAMCEVLELAKDIKHSLYNSHKFVCEISQNVLYQYTLMLLWFCMVIGLVVSLIGLFRTIMEQFCPLAFTSHAEDTKEIAKEVNLTLRECQYLEYIRKKKLSTFKEVLKVLRDKRGGSSSSGRY